MRQVWEEQWEIRDGEDVWGPLTRTTVAYGPMDEAAMKLIAAAPDMARLLLAMHAEHGERHTFDWAYWFSEIEEVLTKAGVPFPE